MALSGGKRLTELPSGTNIGVNVQNFGNVLDPVLKATEEKVNYDEKQSELNFKRDGIDFNRNVALLEQESRDFVSESKALAKEKKLLDDATEVTHDISLGRAIIELEDYVFDLALANPNNPTKIAEGIDNFYNTIKKGNPIWLQDNNRSFKFLEKKQSLFRAKVGASAKSNRTFIAEENWDITNDLTQRYSAEVLESIASMDTISDLSNFLDVSTSSMNSIQTGFQQWFDKNGYLGLHNQQDASDIVMEHVFERDTGLLTHIITEFAMDIKNPQSIDMAKAMLEHYKSGQLPSKFNGPIKRKNTLWNNRPLEYNKKGEITNPYKDFRPLLEMINEYTFDGHTAEKRKDIIDTVETAIKNKQTKWNNLYKTANNEKLKELNIAAKTYTENQFTIGAGVVPEHILRNVFVMKDPNSDMGNLIFDPDRYQEYKRLESTNQQLGEIVEYILRGERIESNDGIVKREPADMTKVEEMFNNIDLESLKLLNYNPENGMNVLKDAVIREAFGGADFNVISMFDTINTKFGIDSNSILNTDMTNGVNMMAELNYIPDNIIQHFKNATLLSLEDESDFSTIAKIAIFKNKAFGIDDNEAFNKINPKFNEIINTVFNHVSSGNINAGAVHWKTFLNPADTIIAQRTDALNNHKNVKNEFGQTKMQEIQAQLSHSYKLAVEQDDITSFDFYTSAFGNFWHGRSDAEQDDYLKGGTYDKDSIEISLRNVIKNKNTFAYGANLVKIVTGALTLGQNAWQGSDYKENMQLEKQAQDYVKRYIEDNVINFITMNNPTNEHIDAAYDSAYKKAVQSLANNGLQYDSLVYDAEYPNSNMYVLKGNTVAGNILDGNLKSHEIQENALVFMWHHAQANNKTSDEFAAAYFGHGTLAKDLTIEEEQEYKNNFMAMVGTNQVKLKAVPETRSHENPSYHIFVDEDNDGMYVPYTNNGVAIEWFPNDQFTRINQGYSKDGLARNWATDIVNGKNNLGGKDLEQILKLYNYLDINKLEDKKTLISLLTSQIKAEDITHTVLEGLSDRFKTDEIDTLSEYQTTIAKSFNNWNTIKRTQEKLQFDNEQSARIYDIKKTYNPKLFDLPDNEATKKTIKLITSVAEKVYAETYLSNDAINLPAQYEFVITDIIETLGNIKEVKTTTIHPKTHQRIDKFEWKMTDNKTWKSIVGKDTKFYEYLTTGQFRLAKQELADTVPFNDEQLRKRKLLLDMWGVSYNQ